MTDEADCRKRKVRQSAGCQGAWPSVSLGRLKRLAGGICYPRSAQLDNRRNAAFQDSPNARIEPGGVKMERLEAFEAMLSDIQKQAEFEKRQMEELRAAGKEKTVTYRQYFGNRMFYKMMLDKYREYGLLP